MGENSRDYYFIEDEQGSIRVSDDVIAVIAATAAKETEGVHSLSPVTSTPDLADFFAKKGVPKGVRVDMNGGTCTVDVHLLIQAGAMVTEVAQNVQLNVKNAVESMVGMHVTASNVFVAGVALQK